MIRKIRQLFRNKKQEKGDFSTFFITASAKEKRKLMGNVVRKANEDQRALLEQYKRS